MKWRTSMSLWWWWSEPKITVPRINKWSSSTSNQSLWLLIKVVLLVCRNADYRCKDWIFTFVDHQCRHCTTPWTFNGYQREEYWRLPSTEGLWGLEFVDWRLFASIVRLSATNNSPVKTNTSPCQHGRRSLILFLLLATDINFDLDRLIAWF